MIIRYLSGCVNDFSRVFKLKKRRICGAVRYYLAIFAPKRRSLIPVMTTTTLESSSQIAINRMTNPNITEVPPKAIWTTHICKNTSKNTNPAKTAWK